MRLNDKEQIAIIKNFNAIFMAGDIYLFGSRVDNNKKGGDIDLFIDTKDVDNLLSKKNQLLNAIKAEIGEQKIDIVISTDPSREIEKQARKTGVKLNMDQLRQEKIISECEKHLMRLSYAKQELAETFPLTEQQYINLSQERVQDIDQFIYRFSKLQDTVGNKLIKIVTALYEENIERMTVIDMLNRLEKAGILLANEWQILRELRNALSHDYEDEPQASTELLNAVYEKSVILEKIYYNLKNKI